MAAAPTSRNLLLACLLLAFSHAPASGERLNSKQWLHTHCKAYQDDYAPLINSYLSRYSYGIQVKDILRLSGPPGRWRLNVANVKPVIYIVNNTIHYVDRTLEHMEAGGRFSAGFSTYFSPVIKRCVLQTSLYTLQHLHCTALHCMQSGTLHQCQPEMHYSGICQRK